jgi:hypothetical protein
MRSLGNRPRLGEPHYLTSFGLMPAGAVFADGGLAQV